MNARSWGPRKHRLAVSEPPSLTLGGRICALSAPAVVPERAGTRAPPTLSQRGSRRAPPGRSVLVRDGDPRLRGAEHTRRMARAAQILHSRPSMAAAGRVGWREGRVVRMIPQISLKMAVSFSGEAGEHAPRVRARVDEWSPRDRRTTFRVRAHTAQLRVVTRLPIARAGCKCSSLAPVHGGRDWRLGRRGRAVLNRHVEVAGLDPSNCLTPERRHIRSCGTLSDRCMPFEQAHAPPPSRSMPAARRYAYESCALGCNRR